MYVNSIDCKNCGEITPDDFMFFQEVKTSFKNYDNNNLYHKRVMDVCVSKKEQYFESENKEK